MDEKVKEKRKTRPRQRAVLFEFPPDLYLALKATLRAEGRTIRDWFIEQMQKKLQASPKWRAYLALESTAIEALERGSLRRHKP